MRLATILGAVVMIEGWIVLPDRPDVQRVATKWPSQSRWALAHASGNPWLLGSLDQEVTLASVGPLRVAVIGACPVTATRLTDLAAGVRSVAELDAVARELPGCFHLVASVDGTVRVQSSATGARRVFHTRVQGLPIAGDRAGVLTRVANSGTDEEALAVRVAGWWTVPPSLDERRLSPDLRALDPGHYLRIDSSGTVDVLRWRQPLESHAARTVGAGTAR